MLRDLFSLFPACAGVILSGHGSELSQDAFPRMCGGDPRFSKGIFSWVGFSPHVRG